MDSHPLTPLAHGGRHSKLGGGNCQHPNLNSVNSLPLPVRCQHWRNPANNTAHSLHGTCRVTGVTSARKTGRKTNSRCCTGSACSRHTSCGMAQSCGSSPKPTALQHDASVAERILMPGSRTNPDQINKEE